jgi:hypothetical protein
MCVAVNLFNVMIWSGLLFTVCFDNIVLAYHLISRREKEIVKALETPEEKRARRLAKKVLYFFFLCRLFIT